MSSAGPGAASGFAALLRRYREGTGLTQEEFAAKASVGVRTLRDLERGRARPQRSTVELLATALDLGGAVRDEFHAIARYGGRPAPAEGGGVNLPPAPVLIGRDNELDNLAAALRQAALVTLVGVAGVGKTSLGWAVAHRVAGRHPAGVAGIAISEVSTGADVVAAIAPVLNAARPGDLPRRLAGRPALLLVDGVERNAESAVAGLCWLREHAPSVRVIATGRHPTGISGEYVWPVSPLEVPPAGLADLDKLAEFPAVRLFLDRLHRIGEAGVAEADAGALGELVRRLDGLPLALELAAARGRVLAVPEILRRYGDRVLDLSQPGPEGEPGSLREAIAVSYRLLEPAERAALRRLAVFRNRWSVELAEPLLAGLTPPVPDVVTLLDRLVGLGLVTVRGTGPARFRVLDVVREFAAELAGRQGELPEVTRRHAEVFADFAAEHAPELVGPTLTAAAGRFDEFGSDLRAALVHAAQDDPQTALRLAAMLPRWWRLRGRDRDGRKWLRRLLDDPRTAGADPALRAWARLGAGQLAMEHGEGLHELPELDAALATFTRLGDIGGQLAVRNQLCVLHQAYGHYTESRRHGEAVLRLATKYGRTRDMVVAQNNLTWHEIRVGDLGAARRRLAAVVRLAASLSEDRLAVLAWANQAEVARLDGRYPDAVAIGRRSLLKLEELGDPRHKRRVLGCVALALAQSGRPEDARELLPQVGDDGVGALIEAYAELAGGRRAEAAERFAAAAQALTGRHDIRDVVEALVGLAAATDDDDRRAAALAELDELCACTATSLLPRERALLGRES